MLDNLNQKDMRALKLGAVGIAAMVFLLVVWDVNERWTKAQESFETINTKLDTLDTIDMTKAEYAALKNTVPVFEMPVEKGVQKFLFQDSLNEQFKKSNIKSQPWEEINCKSKLLTGYEVLALKTSGKCNITQLIDLLAKLKENPYLISIEELMIKTDEKNKQQVNFEMTLSTPAKKISKG
ncbi:MAG: hypothetical protein JXA96_00670 [Sedimentisphaerales bacterium]|nr:hypothetical protein [Sedimentisphaerales bacterium]